MLDFLRHVSDCCHQLCAEMWHLDVISFAFANFKKAEAVIRELQM